MIFTENVDFSPTIWILQTSIKKFTETLSPKGNRAFFGGGGDGTKHGKADKREACMIATPGDDSPDDSDPHVINPSFCVTTTASPVGGDSKANSEHCLDSIK